MEQSEQSFVEFIILADHVEVLNSKLYMMGGGWDSIGVQTFQAPIALGIGLSIQIPWAATESPHQWSVMVETMDGSPIVGANGAAGAARSSFVPEGASQRVLIALKMPVQLPGPGTYAVVASVDGGDSKTIQFRAQSAAPPPAAARA